MMRWVAGLILLAYTVGLHWIYISLHDYGHLPAWLAALATLLLAAYVSLYTMGAVITCRWVLRLPVASESRPTSRVQSRLTPFLIAAIVTLFEWLRGTLLTGFPWLSLGYLVIDTPLSGFAKVLGVYGVGFVAALSVVWTFQALRYRQWFAFAALVFGLGLGAILNLVEFTSPHGKPLRVALVQGAIPQSMKFDPARESQSLATQLAIADVAATPGGTQLIVFPETALVRPWDLAPTEIRAAFYRLAQRGGATIMLGLPMRDPDGYRNSVIAIADTTPAASIYARYDKHHLVPFGEFIPFGFRWFVDQMQMPLGDFQRGAKVQPPIGVADQRIGVNICFEDLFGEEIIRPLAPTIEAVQQPTILLNVSNLAWFGDTIALGQHLAIARMRSKETGRPTIRSTNTGATALIDHRGAVIEVLPYNKPGLLVAASQGMQGLTPYLRWGNQPILLTCVVLLMIGLWPQIRQRIR